MQNSTNSIGEYKEIKTSCSSFIKIFPFRPLLVSGEDVWGGWGQEALAYFLRSLGTEMLTAHKAKPTRCVWPPMNMGFNTEYCENSLLGFGIKYNVEN